MAAHTEDGSHTAPTDPPKSVPEGEATVKTAAPKTPRPRRPNYAQIHSKPLPLDVYPLPAFVPHNPLSIVRIVFALLSDSLRGKTSHVAIYKAYISSETQSIHVTDARSIRALWEQGFWGAGSLSRSEPRWLDQEKRKRGVNASQTSEEYTRQRRDQRKQFKLERARKEREIIEEQQRSEGKNKSATGPSKDDTATESSSAIPETSAGSSQKIPNGNMNGPSAGVARPSILKPAENSETDLQLPRPFDGPEDQAEEAEEIVDQEHLQFTLEEAFFLSYVLGVLDVVADDKSLSSSYLFWWCCINSTFPVADDALKQLQTIQRRESNSSIGIPNAIRVAPDNTFILKYVVFHHFRSLGWVVRPGIKFAVDYLLYNRGPAFSHAEFAVMIIPSYTHPYWSETPELIEQSKKKEYRDWWWLHRINRVQTQVHKTLVLVYVDIPPPWDSNLEGESKDIDVGNILKKYKVREFVWRRWTPNRNRD